MRLLTKNIKNNTPSSDIKASPANNNNEITLSSAYFEQPEFENGMKEFIGTLTQFFAQRYEFGHQYRPLAHNVF